MRCDAARAGSGHRVWRPATGSSTLDLRYVLGRLRPGRELPAEDPPSQAALPGDGREPERSLRFLLKPAEKRALDLLADWPWILQKNLAGLLALSETRVSRLTNPLEGFGLVTRVPAAGAPPGPHRPGAGDAGPP